MSLEVKKRFKISYYDIDGKFVWSKIDYFKNQEEANKEIYVYLYIKYRRNEFQSSDSSFGIKSFLCGI